MKTTEENIDELFRLYQENVKKAFDKYNEQIRELLKLLTSKRDE